MIAFQMIAIVFCVVQFISNVLRIRRSRRGVSIVFSAVWLSGVVLLVKPDLTTAAANSVGIGRGTDLVFYSLGCLFLWAHIQQYWRYKRVEEHVSTLVRELAINSARKPHESAHPQTEATVTLSGR